MPSIRTERPNEPDAAAAIREELGRALIHLIQAGCAYADEYPDALDDIARVAADSFVAGPLGRADERDEAER